VTELRYVRSLPRAHRVLGWTAMLGTPVATITAVVVVFWGFVTWDEAILGLAAASPFGNPGPVTLIAIALASAMSGPLLFVTGYLRWLQRRFGEATLEDGFVVFRSPFAGTTQAPLAGIEQREPTRFGLRVKPAHFSSWVLLPAEGLEAAHGVIATLDELEHRERIAPPLTEPAPLPPESRIRVEGRGEGELRLSWPLIRAERARRVWLFTLATLPVYGLGLIFLPGLLLNGRRRNQLRLSVAQLSLRGVPFSGGSCDLQREQVEGIECASFMVWARVGGRRVDLLDQQALPEADVRWLYRVLVAWHAETLELGPG